MACLATYLVAAAAEYHGLVTFGALPVPGATVTVTQGERKLTAVTDQQGAYSFPALGDGPATIEVEMQCFATIKQDVVIGPNTQAATWELQLLPLDQIKGQAAPAALAVRPAGPQTIGEEAKPQSNSPATEPPQEDVSQPAADSFLINGSVNNGAASPFAQLAAFGNARNNARGLYHGGIGFRLDNSTLDARPFSLSGLSIPKAAYNRVTGVATLGGPLRIPHLFRHGPDFFVSYQWTRDRDATTQSSLVPDLAERQGDFSHELNALGQPVQIFNPATGLPFPGNVVPISPQAQALLNLYPLPNVAGNPRYNYQTPSISNQHQDALQSRFDKTVNRKNEIYGGFAFQHTRSDTANLFAFLDKTNALGINTGINWSHRFTQRVALNLGYRFTRLSTQTTPFWSNRSNVSGRAGIAGNNQDPANWGPPSLVFSGGLAGLSDEQSFVDHNQTSAFSYAVSWNHYRHNITLGGDFRRQQFNYLSQEDPRGTFTFTGAATRGPASGAATSSDLADFLLGVPDASSIAFGNADKYFRESVYDAYVTDDWRVNPQLTINSGMRWEYGAPIKELFGRLVNLEIAPGFAALAPVVANDPVGPLTGQRYPDSLLRPDKHGLEPRVGVAWRPIAGSSMVVRAGYGIYYDTSVYQNIALQMAQQAPLSKSLSVQNSLACPLTLANGFKTCSSITPDTFAVDPNFRVGYAQNWQLAVQRDLSGSLQLTAIYLGTKGARGAQEFLPNTFPPGAINPCPACPSGFAYLTSNGNSTREAGQVQLRRRLHNGLTATAQYTFSKSIDDDSNLGGQGPLAATQNTQQNPFNFGAAPAAATTRAPMAIAQNWLNLRAERGLSTFDQRHILNVQVQYTTGMGLGGGTLISGWKGALFKGWTVLTQIGAGSGLPETPVYLAAVPGTGITGSIRPDVTGASLHAASRGLFLNPAAYTAPAPGQWGNAGRDSITGPAQFTWNGSIGRTFFQDHRYNLDLRIDSTNIFNHVTFAGWNTTINSAQFGLPTAANAMRRTHTTLNMRF
jgi:hypothetical protein